jgi:uncharacterized protein
MASTPADSAASAAPVTKAARVESLDILRGVAVFGILMMNITAFGLVIQAYDNPLVAGGATGWNLTAFKIINLGFEGTMRGIFSLLFGAGIVLLTERMEQAGAGIMAAEVHFRRMLWMLLAGIIHWTLMLWFGEILFNYAICGMLLFALRKLAVKTHLIVAAMLLVGASAMSYGYAQSAVASEAAASEATAAKASGAKLTEEQGKAIEAWQEQVSHTSPTAEEVVEQRGWHTGSYWNAVKGQFALSYDFQWTGSPRWLMFDMIPFMLIGMALLKLGVLSGRSSTKTYLLMMLGGYAVGLAFGWRELHLILDSNFARLGFVAAGETYQFSRLAMVIGHLGLLLLIIRSGVFGALQRAMGAVGQMALTNYLMQTVICTLLFYGFGFGLWGQLERYQLYGVVAAIWLVELIWSPLWLAWFRFGPFEWVWRSLTYWQRQPMRI